MDDSFYAVLGCKIIDIVSHSDLFEVLLVNWKGMDNKYHLLVVIDKNLMLIKNNYSIINLPFKVPMRSPPKPYAHNKLGGYLLNDEKFDESLFVEKKSLCFNFRVI